MTLRGHALFRVEFTVRSVDSIQKAWYVRELLWHRCAFEILNLNALSHSEEDLYWSCKGERLKLQLLLSSSHRMGHKRFLSRDRSIQRSFTKPRPGDSCKDWLIRRDFRFPLCRTNSKASPHFDLKFNKLAEGSNEVWYQCHNDNCHSESFRSCSLALNDSPPKFRPQINSKRSHSLWSHRQWSDEQYVRTNKWE